MVAVGDRIGLLSGGSTLGKLTAGVGLAWEYARVGAPDGVGLVGQHLRGNLAVVAG